MEYNSIEIGAVAVSSLLSSDVASTALELDEAIDAALLNQGIGKERRLLCYRLLSIARYSRQRERVPLLYRAGWHWFWVSRGLVYFFRMGRMRLAFIGITQELAEL